MKTVFTLVQIKDKGEIVGCDVIEMIIRNVMATSQRIVIRFSVSAVFSILT